MGPPPKPIPRWDVHFGGIDDDRKDATALHITFRPQLSEHRQCGLSICTFHLGFSLEARTGGNLVLFLDSQEQRALEGITIPATIQRWYCLPSSQARRFPLPGSRFGPASSWGPLPCLAVWPSGWPWGSFSGGTAGRSVQTAVTIPWAGTSAGTGSPSFCKPAVLPVSSSVFGERSTWRCF